jgi:hypothetical protein
LTNTSSVREAWDDAQLGQLVALEKIRLLMMDQSLRHGVPSGLPPPPRKDEPDEPERALVD